MSRVSDELRAKLQACSVPRRQISAVCGVSESQLSRFVNDDTGLGLQSIEALADYFGLRLALLPKSKRRKS